MDIYKKYVPLEQNPTTMKKNKEQRNIYEAYYSSKIKRITIPIPGFKKFNRTVTEEGDSEYIEREPIMSQLLDWLKEEHNFTGACLVTGYRGMGKSSFVGKVLSKMTSEKLQWKHAPFLLKFLWLVVSIIYYTYYFNIESINQTPGYIWFFLISTLTVIAYYLFLYLKNNLKKQKFIYHAIKINVGREVYNEKDILFLLTKNVYQQFLDYYKNASSHLLSSFTALFIKWSILCLAIWQWKSIDHLLECITNKNLISQWVDCFQEHSTLLGYSIYFFGGYALLSIIEKFILIALSRHTSFRITSLYVIKKKLENLNERIDASINQEISANKWGLGFSKRKQYAMASVREIELELIQVFDQIDKIGGITLLYPKVRFVFVLDELDKAEINQKEHKKEGTQEVIPAYNPSNRGFNGESARVRKENLLHTLAGMKYFLSTVKAKFIFVAGQELYDAYLADLSDREFSISSVFNQVISVKSFLKAGSGDDDIYTMSERFVCKKLMTLAERSSNGKLDEKKESLAQYYRIQKQKLSLTKKDTEEKYASEEELDLERKIHFLYHFVFYLMHISNGSPKKMALNFDTFVRSADFCIQKGYLKKGKKEAEYYLTFGDSSISKINFVHYLAYPVVQSLLNKSQIYTDKQMISTSFMINHIYKYHNIGFSWRNLEHIPELLDINKTPELRDFIGSIVTFLCQVHLEWVSSGLYLFKFPMRIAEEISFASNKSEELSALFNFSRDESLPTKEHYISLLKYYSDNTNTGCQGRNPSLASIHHILGDIYLADEDYTQAIFEYQTALQLLKEQIINTGYDKDGHWVSRMIFFMRNMLKLGLAFEKRKTFNSAYATYGELVHKLVDFRFLNEEELGLVYEKEETGGKMNDEEVAYLHKPYPFSYEDKRHKIWEEKPWDGKYKKSVFISNRLRSDFSSIVSPQLKAILSRLSSFEDVRFVYLGTLSRLAVLEKMQMGGITRTDLQIAIDEFKYFHITADSKVRPIIAIDFYKKLAEILYYKMGLFSDKDNTFAFALYVQGYDLKKDLEERLLKKCTNFIKAKKLIETIISQEKGTRIEKITQILKFNISEHIMDMASRCQKRRKEAIEKDHSLPCLSCKFYNISLNKVIEDVFNQKTNEQKTKIETIIHILHNQEKSIHVLGEQIQNAIGSTLEGLGNVYLSCAGIKKGKEGEKSEESKEGITNEKFLQFFLNLIERGEDSKKKFNNKEFNCKELKHLEKSILYFWFASVFYKTAGRRTASFRCYKHILEIFLMQINLNKKNNDNDITHLSDINKCITRRALSIIYAHYDYINISEIQNLKSIYDINLHDNILLSKLSLYPDIEEFLHIVYSIELATGNKLELIKKYYNSIQSGRFKQISTLSQNISNLRFKVLLNKELLSLLGFEINIQSLLFDQRKGLIGFYEQFKQYFDEPNDNFLSIDKFMRTSTDVEDEDVNFKKKELLEFLIADSMFCLSKCITLITPIKNSTLFTNNFIAHLYRNLFFWNQLFECVYNIYLGTIQEEKKDPKRIIRKNEKYIGKYGENNKKNRKELLTYYRECVNTVLTLTVNEKELAENFIERIKRAIGEDYHKHLISNYITGNALKYYKRAMEIHTEGNEYKEMISNLHFLDDDLNNDTCQFYLGIERYKINSGHISVLINVFEHLQNKSSIYKSDYYITPNKDQIL